MKAAVIKQGKHWLGVDTGGTFTDFVYFDGSQIRIHKVLSTPHAPEQAILQGIEEMQLSTDKLHVIHGSTVATNAVLENKGVKTVYIANRGFRDVLSIGRQARRELYNLMPEPRPSLIPQSQCLEVNTRRSASGEILQPLHEEDLEYLLHSVRKLKPDAMAINLLFSFLSDKEESEIKSYIQQELPELFICCSHEVLSEYGEYERGMATALNAYVGPLMQGYLQRLGQALKKQKNTSDSSRIGNEPALSILQSSGGTIDATQAGKHAVSLLLSGPAGGLKGAQYIGGLAGEQRLLSFDMGGTSTDVALLDGKIRLTSEGAIGDYPVAVPMVDMHTIGAGGGSIAYVDDGGLLNVGPESAGASPGPACYGQGGLLPTVTDANLLLGRLRVDGFLGNEMQLDINAAKQAMQSIADKLELSIEETALGVISIANEHMVRALRTISVQRGHDPEDFSLTCFGGAGGLHVCALAEALQMKRALVPVHGGVLSALGMLVSSPSRELSQSVIRLLPDIKQSDINHMFALLEKQAVEEMQAELDSAEQASMQYSLDMRYHGQSFTLNLSFENNQQQSIAEIEKQFHLLHNKTYGHKMDMPVELVNVRLSIRGETPPFNLPEVAERKPAEPDGYASCYGKGNPVAIYNREELCSEQIITGPALILEKVSTTWIEQGWQCRVDSVGNLLLAK